MTIQTYVFRLETLNEHGDEVHFFKNIKAESKNEAWDLIFKDYSPDDYFIKLKDVLFPGNPGYMNLDKFKALVYKHDGDVKCNSCRNILEPNFTMYLHSDGLADNENDKWWVYIVCPYCGYQNSFKKVIKQIQNNTLLKALGL